MRVTLLDKTRLRLLLCPTSGSLRLSAYLCALCVNRLFQRRRRRGALRAAEKIFKLPHYGLLCILLLPLISQAANPISLDGVWWFNRDPDDIGVVQQWFNRPLRFNLIRLPGSLQWQNFGNDITTDTQDPPDFATLAAVREQAPNKAAYGGPDVAAQQLQAYPNIKAKVLSLPPAEAVQKSIDAARSLGWQIAGSDTAAGRIEATDTTGWFGFKDDIVVRVRPQAQGSRVDVRSASRVGRSDIGKNAERIREFLDKLG